MLIYFCSSFVLFCFLFWIAPCWCLRHCVCYSRCHQQVRPHIIFVSLIFIFIVSLYFWLTNFLSSNALSSFPVFVCQELPTHWTPTLVPPHKLVYLHWSSTPLQLVITHLNPIAPPVVSLPSSLLPFLLVTPVVLELVSALAKPPSTLARPWPTATNCLLLLCTVTAHSHLLLLSNPSHPLPPR